VAGAVSRSPVLLVSYAGVFGGAERVLLDWARALERPAIVACPPGALATAAQDAGLGIAALPARPLARRGRTAAAAADLGLLGRDIARLARRVRPAVIVASGERSLLGAAAAPLAGARLLAIAHDLPRSRVAGALLAAAAARAGAVVVTSAAIAARFRRAEVVHPGVDMAAWAVPDPPPGAARALVLGALVPWKRADLALEIAARVPGLRLDLAGAPLPGDPPGFAAALRDRAARPDLHGRVRFLGAVGDPRTALADAHLLLHCADREPFGLALVEALAAGRPVVAPAAGGPLEIVTPACGRLYRPGDADAAARAVAEVLADPPPPAAAHARAAAFDAATAARRFAAIVEDLAGGR
jgi:glycosyltransferase involved in cell wall biosynthesis